MSLLNPKIKALENYAESSVLIAAVGVVTDICRAMRVNELQQFFKDLMTLLYKALREYQVHHTVKPQIISAFGDAALALGPGFVDVSFLQNVITNRNNIIL